MLSSLANAAGLSRPKKKFHFDVSFRLEELLHCTYVAGLIFSKIRLRDGGTFSEISNRRDVQTHIVQWNQQFDFHCKMYGGPVTGELEPCLCKVSIRKETKGGRSYKKLGFVKINLAEYAGAGATQRKYLLESYNENKHKPDNSILKVTISLRLTSGDSLFKVPRGAGCLWELGEDEGIQPDMQAVKPYLSYSSSSSTHISATSSSPLYFFPSLPGGSSVCGRGTGNSDMGVGGGGDGSGGGGGGDGGATGGGDGSAAGGGDGSAASGGGDGSATGDGGGVTGGGGDVTVGGGGVTGGGGGVTGGGGGATARGDGVATGGGDDGATGGGNGGATGGGDSGDTMVGGDCGETGVSGIGDFHRDIVEKDVSEKSGGEGGWSLQDIRWQSSGDIITRETNSTSNPKRQSIYDLSVVEEASPLDPQPSIGDHTHSRTFPLTLNVNRAGSLDDDGPEEHTGYIGNSRFGLSAMGGRPTHRRLGSWSQASNGTSPTSTHRRQQSLVSGQSSKSTSAYSTLSERSTAGSMEEGGGEVDSMYGSLRGRPAMASSTSSRVEQSRVNPHAVIENLFSIGNVSHHEEAELVDQDQGGLKIYVDRNLGTITLAGPHLDRRNTNLQPIDVDKHKSSPKRRHRRGFHQTSPPETPPPSSPPPQPDSPHAARASMTVAEKSKHGQTRLWARAPSASSSDSTKTLTPGR